ncbi:MAG: zinc ribbon domain-containing protein [Nitrospinota bacterium]|jgi:putative FmdB family regulatory protein|nr:zinc ribbon domain-containing protein [Nitrospinota bacterium]MDP6482620.1 zinc ribbon domain-containing protein [Nitrospinota bacterium]MDP6618355.1 zinc ribbon domain-containing protein [Nitrospinota bacterium]MDP7385115.1 zinc ribbon domain-containing protein [Nitrospinota bacterium]HJM42950.1 zinc ribbon domain-containing protein [Nitrospinota bacterium]
MPIYEYACADCEAEFEKLIMGAPEGNGAGEAVTCPSCDSASVAKKFSSFAVKSDYVPISTAPGKPAGGGGGCCGGFCGCG